MGAKLLEVTLSLLVSSTITYAEVYYRQDFEGGAADWQFYGCEISTKFAHSGAHSVVSIGEGAGVPDGHARVKASNVDQFF